MCNGFSLIELLIVLGIMGVLSLIATPRYNDYITRAHRTDGQLALFELANRMERYYFDNNDYSTARIGGHGPHTILSSEQSAGGHYKLSIEGASASAYRLQATPIGVQATRDAQCQSLTLTHAGKKNIEKGPTGMPKGTALNCW